jgi:hypothetical protein
MLKHSVSELGIVERGEAIQLLREILNRCSVGSIHSVSLISPTLNNGSTGYQLKIGTTLNTAFRNGLMILLKEKGLDMAEEENCITIYNAQQINCFSHV